MTPDVEAELSVRVLFLNGMLTLQVGRFSKEYSPRMLQEGSLAAYETYVTLTSFPLMYFSYRHGIPARYLNLVADAIPSYKADKWNLGTSKKNDWVRDWRALHKDVAAYRVLCESDDDSNVDKWIKFQKAFDEKSKKLLAAEGYKSYGINDDRDEYMFPDLGCTYWNSYGQVFFRNTNANRDTHHEREWLAGYHEERP